MTSTCRKVLACLTTTSFIALVSACSGQTSVGGHGDSNVVTQSSGSGSGTVSASGSTSPKPSSASATGSGSGTVTASGSPSAKPSSAEATARKDLKIVAQGFTQLPADSIGSKYLSYAVIVDNPNSPSAAHPFVASRVNVNITFTDDSGAVVKSQSETIDSVLPGQKMAAGDSVQAKGAKHMEVKALVDSWDQNDAPITGSFKTSGVTSSNDGFGQKTAGNVASTFDKDYKDLSAVAVYYNSTGHIIGGANTFVDFIPANNKASFEIQGLSAPTNISRTSVYAGFSTLSLLGS
jgi:hypothetical protein